MSWNRSPIVLLLAIIIGYTNAVPGASGQGDYLIEGFSQPFRMADVASATGGIVEEQSTAAGMRVEEGDPLCRLDSKVHQKILKSAEVAMKAVGDIQLAQNELELAKLRRKTIRGLAERQHASVEELLRAEMDFRLAESRLQIARENQMLKEAEYEKLLAASAGYIVRAPFSGVVIKYEKEKGEFVGPGDPVICSLAELERLSVDFLVPRHYLADMKSGTGVNVYFLESDRTVEGTVYYTSPFPDGETDTFTVRVRVNNQDRRLNAGERCHLQFKGERETAKAANLPNGYGVRMQ